MKAEPLVKEVTIKATPARIWKAITDKNEMKQWYFDLADFKAVVGFEFSFEGGPPEKVFNHLCEVTEVVPQKKLTYSWRYEGYAGISHVTFEILPQGETTLLRLTHTGIETFPADTADFKRENFNMGWTQLIQTQLKEYAEKD